jgi:hypothetical protein
LYVWHSFLVLVRVDIHCARLAPTKTLTLQVVRPLQREP